MTTNYERLRQIAKKQKVSMNLLIIGQIEKLIEGDKKLNQITDEEIRERLTDLDNSDKDVDSWTANFIESIVFKWKGPLSEKQRTKAIEVLERYKF